MKKIVIILSIVGLVGALIQATWLALYRTPAAPELPPPSAAAFQHFPQDQARPINFEADEDTLSTMSHREQLDQLRDWLLLTALSDAGLTTTQLYQIGQDLPAIRYFQAAYAGGPAAQKPDQDLSAKRYGATQPLGALEYGLTRSRYIGDGQIIALLPVESEKFPADQRRDALAQIVDQHRKDTGVKPTSLLVFDYFIDPDMRQATMTRHAPLDASALYTASYGYYEATITSLNDLKRLLEQIDDITFAHMGDTGLTLGGRRVRGHVYRGINLEDIAAIWQAQAKIHVKLAAFKARWQREVDSFNSRWKLRTFRTETEHLILERQRDQEMADLEARRDQEFQQLGIPQGGGTGFSLDPSDLYEYGKLKGFFIQIKPILEKLAGAAQAQITANDIKQAEAGLERQDATTLLDVVYKLVQHHNPGIAAEGRFLAQQIETFRIQAARYDGELQGTHVGMVLFYTDLLAKLWALDYMDSAPDRYIDEFAPLTDVAVSPVYKQEIEEQNKTRLWFGPQSRGYQEADKGDQMLFARNATRLYAASSDISVPGVESAPNAASIAFLGWWDNHYDEVARYEPAYEQLNQIMKWSLLASWLHEAEKGELLGFLNEKQVPVDRTNWFPDWAPKQSGLTFRHWDDIHFYQRGDKALKGLQTEALPKLYSREFTRFGESQSLFGGVSLGSEALFEEGRILPQQLDALSLRSNWAYETQGLLEGHLRTIEGVTYDVETLTSKSAWVRINAEEGTLFKASFSELPSQPIYRGFLPQADGFEFATRLGETEFGSLKVVPTEQGFVNIWHSRQLDMVQSLTNRLSTSSDMARSLVGEADVTAAIKLPGKDSYLIKLKDTDNWLKIAPETTASTTVPPGWDARVAANTDHAQVLLAGTVKDADALDFLGKEGYITMLPHEGEGGMMLRNVTSRAPPAGLKPIEIQNGPTTLKGLVDPKTGEIYFGKGDLPEALQQDPSRLVELVREEDLQQVRRLASEGDTIHYRLPEQRFLADDPFAEALRARRYEDAARELAADPNGIKLWLKQHLDDGLRQSDHLINDGKYAKAIHELDDMIKIHGPLPELSLRKGIAEIKLGNAQQAARTLNETAFGVLSDDARATQFFDEVSGRLPGLEGLEQENVYHMAEMADWKRLQARGLVPEGDVVAFADGEHLLVGYHPRTSLLNDRVPISAAADSRVPLYVQDSPGLHNFNWEIGIDRSLREIDAGNLGQAVRLPRGPVEHFKPAVVYDPTGKVLRLKRPSLTTTVRPVLNLYQPYTPCEEGDPHCQQGADQAAYAVIANS